MGIEINTGFNPFRLSLSRREPVQLFVEIRNESSEEAMLTLKVDLNQQLSFEKTGYKTAEIKRISTLPTKQVKRFYFNVYPKQATRSEEQPIKITVLEHYKSYNYIKKEYNKKLTLKVEK